MDAHETIDDEAPSETAPRRARAIQVGRHDSVAVVARAAIAEASAHFLENASALSEACERELVHQSRVGVRRLRVFVALFRGRIGKKRARRLGLELRALFRLLGTVRDLQLFEGSLLAKDAARAPAVQKRLAGRLTKARGELIAALTSTGFHTLRAELELLPDRPPERPGGGKSARRFLKRRLERLHRRARRSAATGETYEALHQLRKQLKTLRYTAELGAALYPRRKKRVRRYLRALRAVQDELGAWVDEQVARGLSDELLAPAQAPLGAAEDERGVAELTPSLPTFLAFEPFWT